MHSNATPKIEICDFGENLVSQQYKIDSKDGTMTC
jgi:hypothetical protein